MKKKRKTKVVDINEPACFAARPPWENARTKRIAWLDGINEGRQEGYDKAQQEFAEEKRKFDEKEKAVRLEVLRQIGQAGSSVIESMTKAILCYEKQL